MKYRADSSFESVITSLLQTLLRQDETQDSSQPAVSSAYNSVYAPLLAAQTLLKPQPPHTQGCMLSWLLAWRKAPALPSAALTLVAHVGTTVLLCHLGPIAVCLMVNHRWMPQAQHQKQPHGHQTHHRLLHPPLLVRC